MKIEDLPNGIKQLAKKRREEYGGTGDFLSAAFVWDKTNEGDKFWMKIDGKKFKVYRKLYPKHGWINDYLGEFTLYVDENGKLCVSKMKGHIPPSDYNSLDLANGYYAGVVGVNNDVREAWAAGFDYANRQKIKRPESLIFDKIFEPIDATKSEVILIPPDPPVNKYLPQMKNPPPTPPKPHPSLRGSITLMDEGIKEEYDKPDYSEINFDILDLMAKRFKENKVKYPHGNSKKKIDIRKLEFAALRHLVKMIQPKKKDNETYEDHLAAILCNCSMILDQIELNKKE